MEINRQVIMISGGGSGIGAACASYFSEAGAKVVVFDANENNAYEVAEKVKGLAFVGDVMDESAVEAAFQNAGEKVGCPRILMNCAGIAPAAKIVGRHGPHELELFQRVININLIGTFNMLRIGAHYMSQAEILPETKERGVIINIASISAFEGQIGQAAYSASKGGIAALTLPAARELAVHGIRVCTIAPGVINTPLMSAMPEKVQESLKAEIPFPSRFGEPHEVAELAGHIVTNSYLNGTIIRCDGALRMK